MRAHVPCPARGSCLSGGELCSVRMVPGAALHLRVCGDRDVVLLFKSSLKLHLPLLVPCLPPLASCPGFCEQTRIDHSN